MFFLCHSDKLTQLNLIFIVVGLSQRVVFYCQRQHKQLNLGLCQSRHIVKLIKRVIIEQSLCSNCVGSLETVSVISISEGFWLLKSWSQKLQKSRLGVVAPFVFYKLFLFLLQLICNILCWHSKTRLIQKLRSNIAEGWRAGCKDRVCGSCIVEVELGTDRITSHFLQDAASIMKSYCQAKLIIQQYSVKCKA